MSERKTVSREEVPESIRNQFPEQKNFILVDAPRNQQSVQVIRNPSTVYQSQVVLQQAPVVQAEKVEVKETVVEQPKVVAPAASLGVSTVTYGQSFQGRKPAYTQDDVPEEIRNKFPTIGSGFTGTNIVVRNLGKVEQIPEKFLQQNQEQKQA